MGWRFTAGEPDERNAEPAAIIVTRRAIMRINSVYRFMRLLFLYIEESKLFPL